MATGEQFVQSVDGTQIFVKQHVATSPKAQLLVIHGYLEHCLRYQEFAEFLNFKDISVTVFDVRGHGQSGGDRAYIDDWKHYEEDLETVTSTLLPMNKLPTFFLGHSNGGLILLNYILNRSASSTIPDHLKGILLSGPYVENMLPRYKVWAGKVLGSIAPKLTVPSDMKVAHLTSDPEKQEAVSNDPDYLLFGTIGWGSRVMKTQAHVKQMVETTKIPIPVFLVYGDADPVADPKAIAMIAQKLLVDDKTVVPRKGEVHEVLNESKRIETFQMIADWILEHA